MTWTAWRASWDGCTKCVIGTLAHKHVLGRGSSNADVLLVGEAPGKSEDVIGKPFIGRAGKLLTKMLEDAGVDPKRIYITNLVACRPCDGLGTANRMPTKEEVYNCRPRLVELMDLLKPTGVILVGKPAQLYGEDVLKLSRWSGLKLEIPHPAYLLRQGGENSPGFGEVVEMLREFFNQEGLKNGRTVRV